MILFECGDAGREVCLLLSSHLQFGCVVRIGLLLSPVILLLLFDSCFLFLKFFERLSVSCFVFLLFIFTLCDLLFNDVFTACDAFVVRSFLLVDFFGFLGVTVGVADFFLSGCFGLLESDSLFLNFFGVLIELRQHLLTILGQLNDEIVVEFDLSCSDASGVLGCHAAINVLLSQSIKFRDEYFACFLLLLNSIENFLNIAATALENVLHVLLQFLHRDFVLGPNSLRELAQLL